MYQHGRKWKKHTVTGRPDQERTVSSSAAVYNHISTSTPRLLSGNTLYAAGLSVRVFLPGEDGPEGVRDMQAWMGGSW